MSVFRSRFYCRQLSFFECTLCSGRFWFFSSGLFSGYTVAALLIYIFNDDSFAFMNRN